MKKVDLFGCTTAEKLIALENAYNELFDTLIANAKPVGVYNAETVYEYGNMVTDAGGSFIYINDVATEGVSTTNTAYWFQIAAKGAAGIGISHIENDGYSDGNGFTISHIKATLNDGKEEHFDVQARDGQSVTDVTSGTPIIDGEYTKTPVTFHFNGSDQETVEILAKNGENGIKYRQEVVKMGKIFKSDHPHSRMRISCGEKTFNLVIGSSSKACHSAELIWATSFLRYVIIWTNNTMECYAPVDSVSQVTVAANDLTFGVFLQEWYTTLEE